MLGALAGMTATAAAHDPAMPPSSPADQSAGTDSAKTTNTTVTVVTSTVNGIVHGVQNSIETGRLGQQTTQANANTFAPEAPGDLDEVLGYAKRGRVSTNPLYRNPPKSVPAPQVSYAVWGQTYVDREMRSANAGGIDFGRKATTLGGLIGLDAVITNVGPSNAAVVLGVLGSEMTSVVKGNDNSTTHTRGPGTGAYAAYVVGQDSADMVYKVDFLGLNRAAPTVSPLDLGMTNHVFSFNLNHKITLKNSWWLEPTVGFSRTWLIWDSDTHARGYQDGSEWRVQGGVRTGTTFTWNKMRVDQTLSAIIYSPVSIEGGSVALATGQVGAPTDKGKVFGQGIAKLNFNHTDKLSSYVEGEIRGTSGVLGLAGRIGLRTSLQ